MVAQYSECSTSSRSSAYFKVLHLCASLKTQNRWWADHPSIITRSGRLLLVVPPRRRKCGVCPLRAQAAVTQYYKAAVQRVSIQLRRLKSNYTWIAPRSRSPSVAKLLDLPTWEAGLLPNASLAPRVVPDELTGCVWSRILSTGSSSGLFSTLFVFVCDSSCVQCHALMGPCHNDSDSDSDYDYDARY